jgi:hypothetical protein
MAGWTCTKCWVRNGPLRFFCKHCGHSKHGT